MEILAIIKDMLYTITFGGQLQEFSEHLPKVEKMFNSLTILTHKPEGSDKSLIASANTLATYDISTAQLSVQLNLEHKNINRGEDQIITVTVTDKISNTVIAGAKIKGEIKGEVFSPSSSFITLEEKPVDQNGVVTYSWSINKHADTGEFTVVLRVSAEGNEPKSLSDTFRVRPSTGAPISGITL
jgi:hypothetical protein